MQLSWQVLFNKEKKLPYYQEMNNFIQSERAQGKVIFPKEEDVFNAFKYTKLKDVKVVILGQDPYHGENQSHGLSFSVLPGIKIPPSLKNIYKELSLEYPEFEVPSHGCLTGWAEQGVLLLNTVLTVEKGKAHSHAKYGWEKFTDSVLDELNKKEDGIVFMLWGAHAQKKGDRINSGKHLILTAPHPSPLSVYRGFYGCNHFKLTNQWLVSNGKCEIDWKAVV